MISFKYMCYQRHYCYLVTKLCLTLETQWTVARLLFPWIRARLLEWVATSFSRESSWPKNQTEVSCLAGEFFTTEPPGKYYQIYMLSYICKWGWAWHKTQGIPVSNLVFPHGITVTFCIFLEWEGTIQEQSGSGLTTDRLSLDCFDHVILLSLAT